MQFYKFDNMVLIYNIVILGGFFGAKNGLKKVFLNFFSKMASETDVFGFYISEDKWKPFILKAYLAFYASCTKMISEFVQSDEIDFSPRNSWQYK